MQTKVWFATTSSLTKTSHVPWKDFEDGNYAANPLSTTEYYPLSTSFYNDKPFFCCCPIRTTMRPVAWSILSCRIDFSLARTLGRRQIQGVRYISEGEDRIHSAEYVWWNVLVYLLTTIRNSNAILCWLNSRFQIFCITQHCFQASGEQLGSKQKYENNQDQIFGKRKKNDEKTTPANSSSGEESQHQNEWTDPRHPSNNGHTYMTKKFGFGREVAVQLVP